jgi:hypothetical protein
MFWRIILAVSTRNRRAFAYFLGAVIPVKLAVLYLIGPTIWPDTAGYIAFAEAILDRGKAFRPIDWIGGPPAPLFVFRLAGYPLVLGGAELLSAENYASVTVIFQIFLNLVSLILVFKVMAHLGFSIGQIMAVLALYVFSDSLLFDNSILSDSIYSSLFNIVMFSLIGHAIGCWRLTLLGGLGLGFLWGFSTWTRDSGIYFTYVPALLILAGSRASAGGFARRLSLLCAFLIVVVGMTGAYVALNKYRTGEYFFSITGVANWLHPVFAMAKYGYAWPFDGDDPVSEMAREGLPDYEYPTQLAFIQKLHSRCKCTPTELQSLLFSKFLATIAHHPFAYLRMVWRNFHYLGLAALLADPVATINQFFEFATPIQYKLMPGLSIRNLLALQQHFSQGRLLLMILNLLSTAVAAILFSLFVVGTPYLVARAWQRGEPIPPALAIVAFLWFTFLSVSVAFSLVHYEARHALPIFPAGCIGVVYTFSAARRWLGRPEARSAPA